MKTGELNKALTGLDLPAIHYFNTIPSTNTLAMKLAQHNTPDNTLIIADSQTEGRGRLKRKWITRPNSALAFSLVIKPSPDEAKNITRFSALGALAVLQGLKTICDLQVEIKWPNDVLLNGRKVCGILAETSFAGARPDAVVLGIGINIARDSITDDAVYRFPATSIEHETGIQIDRLDILKTILERLMVLRKILSTADFLHSWSEALAYRNRIVNLEHPDGNVLTGRLLGLSKQGKLLLETQSNDLIEIEAGDLSLRPENTLNLS